MEVQVIEKIQVRIDRTTVLQINERLKVVAYARVSTDSEDQLNSFESQVKYYNEKKYQKIIAGEKVFFISLINLAKKEVLDFIYMSSECNKYLV